MEIKRENPTLTDPEQGLKCAAMWPKQAAPTGRLHPRVSFPGVTECQVHGLRKYSKTKWILFSNNLRGLKVKQNSLIG